MVGLRQLATRSPPISGEIAGKHVDEGFRLHFLDVGARGKGFFAAGQQDAPNPVVGFEIVDRGGDFPEYAERQRIEQLRAVERDNADRAFAFDNDVFERAHGPPRA